MAIDTETANELMSSFEDHYEIIQIAINNLIHNNEDSNLINTTFRSIHTIKGNAAMMQVTGLVDYTHALEEAIAAMRSGYFKATPGLCDLILTAIDRLRDLHAKYLFNKEVPAIDEKGIEKIFSAMANARSAEEVTGLATKLAQLFTPHQEPANPTNKVEPCQPKSIDLELSNVGNHRRYLNVTENQNDDLLMFRLLALQVDEQNHFWHKRTDLLLYLAIKTASLSERDLDLTQLVAGVYMHDVGMAFIPDDIVNKTNRLNAMESKKLQQHPIWGHGLLRRMVGWEVAAQMTLQHQERVDGEGYPYKKKGNELCDGAKLLAILDAYYAMTNLRADRSHRRSIMRAVSEVNACIDSQFDAYWVSLFNEVIRTEVKAGTI